MTYPEAVIEGTETYVLRSELTGKEYRISVGLPYDYHDEPEKKWPVVYHLDGNVYFGMVTEIVRTMALCGPTSDAVVVGIGYANGIQTNEAWVDFIAMRDHDLTPVRDEEEEKKMQERRKRQVKTGGAGDFLEFIGEEIISLVESSYRVDESERTLVGHSHGGLFVLFALLQNPGQFKNYISGSPSIYWKGQVILEIEKAFASEQSALPARLFLSMGELEKDDSNDSFDGMLRLFDQLESRGYEQFEIVKKIYPDEDHCTVVAPSLQAGLKFALRVK